VHGLCTNASLIEDAPVVLVEGGSYCRLNGVGGDRGGVGSLGEFRRPTSTTTTITSRH